MGIYRRPPPPPTELGKELVQCEHNSCVVCSVYDNDIVSGVMSLFIAKRSFYESHFPTCTRSSIHSECYGLAVPFYGQGLFHSGSFGARCAV